MTIRAFLALYPDPAALCGMSEYVDTLRSWTAGVRWERSSHLHMTMKFLGDIDEARLAELVSQLREALTAWPAEKMLVNRVGMFPSLRRPSIVWLGSDAVPVSLPTLAEIVEETAERLGCPREAKPFQAHITIGRVKDPGRAGNLENDLSACRFTPVQAAFGELRIMKSVLQSTGAVHTMLERIPFVEQV